MRVPAGSGLPSAVVAVSWSPAATAPPQTWGGACFLHPVRPPTGEGATDAARILSEVTARKPWKALPVP